MVVDRPDGRPGSRSDADQPWFQASFDAVLITDHEGVVTAANPVCTRLFGRSEEQLKTCVFAELLTGHRPADYHRMWARLLELQRVEHLDAELATREGDIRSVKIRGFPVAKPVEADLPSSFMFLIRDVTEGLRAVDRWRRSEERYDNLFHFAGDAILIHDLGGAILDANPKASELLGGTKSELRQRQVLDFAPAGARGVLRRAMEQLEKVGSYRFEVDLLRLSGEGLTVAIASSLLSLDGRPVVQSHLRDISRDRTAEHLLRRAHFNDPMTGLPNRTWLEDRLATAIDRAARRGDEGFVVLLLGLDRFQTVNDGLGRAVGDRILVEVASRLRSTIRNEDAVARVGSDEFAVLMPKVTSLIRAREAADGLQKAVSEPMAIDDRTLIVTTSVGIVRCQDTYEQAEECLRDAGAALVDAKTGGVQGQRVFETSMWNRAVRRLDLEQDLRRGLEQEQLRLFYQPIIDLGSGKIRELECLLRWQHPERGIVPPNEFLPVAEETGLITELDVWVLAAAGRAMRRFRNQLRRMAPGSLAVNVSSRGFCRLELVGLVDEVMREHRLSGGSLKVEVTESAMISEIDVAAEVLNRLHERGVHVCLDDFGTGYASLSYLHRFPVSTLKIDRSFVSGPAKGSRIIEAVVLLGHNLDMQVTAEGIETAEDLARVRALGCDKGQGYLFARPLEEAAVVELLQSDPTW